MLWARSGLWELFRPHSVLEELGLGPRGEESLPPAALVRHLQNERASKNSIVSMPRAF